MVFSCAPLVHPLVIIDQIHVVYVALIEAKNYSPVGPDSHGPKIPSIAFERMQFESWQVHVSGSPCAVQNGENVFKFLHVFMFDSTAISIFKETLKSLMAEALDHGQ